MSAALVVFRREFSAYFSSPVGYIYISAFALLNAALYMPPFFAFGRADMSWMFSYLPFLLSALIPLISMRLWAEDRKENTIEMLLTLPVSPYTLVLGKFLAGFAFFAVALVATLPIPVMLYNLGNPDWGVIFASYLGTALLGALFLAVGIFVSGLVRDQIVAAVLSLLASFGLCLSGYPYMVQLLDGWGKEWRLGSLLKETVSVLPHYVDFTRGIIGLPEILYFLVWTALFLFLNGFFLEAKNRPKARLFLIAGVALASGVGALFSGLIAGTNRGRVDCTEGSVHTLSEFSKDLLQKLEAPVMLRIYITPKEEMPSGYEAVEGEVANIAFDMKRAGAGKLDYEVVYLDAGSVREFEEMSQAELDRYFLKDEDIGDWPKLLEKLSGPEPLAGYIREEFPELNELKGGKGELTGEMKDSVLFAFNQLLKNETLYSVQRFRGVLLEEKTARLLAGEPRGKESIELNRLLLEDAYPEIRDKEKIRRTRSAVESLLEKGVTPFRAFTFKDDQQISRVIYSSIGIAYRDKKEVILQPIIPGGLGDLEYKLMSAIVRLGRKKKPVAAVYAPRPEVSKEEREWYFKNGQRVPQGIYEEFEKFLEDEGYDVRETALSREQPLPEHYDVLIVLQPEEIDARQKWEIARALYCGKNVFLAVQTYKFRYSQQRAGAIGIEVVKSMPNLNDLLAHYGIEVSEDILLDRHYFRLVSADSSIRFVPGYGAVEQVGAPYMVDLPNHILAKNSNSEMAITAALSAVPYLWGTALEISDAAPSLEKTILLRTSEEAWQLPYAPKYSDRDFKPPAGARAQYPLMAMVRGQFPDVYRGQPRPAWPKSPARSISLAEGLIEEREPEESSPCPASLILIGCSTPFLNFSTLQYEIGCTLRFLREHRDSCRRLFVNSAETLALGEELIHIRSRGMKEREIEMPTSDAKNLWRFLQFALAPALCAIVWLGRTSWRYWRRTRYSRTGIL